MAKESRSSPMVISMKESIRRASEMERENSARLQARPMMESGRMELRMGKV